MEGGHFNTPADLNGRVSGAVRRAKAEQLLADRRAANMARPELGWGRCGHCYAPLVPPPGDGGRIRYCDGACKQAAYRARHR